MSEAKADVSFTLTVFILIFIPLSLLPSFTLSTGTQCWFYIMLHILWTRTSSIRLLELSRLVMTVQLECFVKVCILLKYLNGFQYISAWDSSFQLSKCAQSPISFDKLESTVVILNSTINRAPLWYCSNANTCKHFCCMLRYLVTCLGYCTVTEVITENCSIGYNCVNGYYPYRGFTVCKCRVTF